MRTTSLRVSEEEEMDLNAQDPANTLGVRANRSACVHCALETLARFLGTRRLEL